MTTNTNTQTTDAAIPSGHVLTGAEYDRFVELEGWLTEYRDTMDRDVLHCWARDVVATGRAVLAIRDRLLTASPPHPIGHGEPIPMLLFCPKCGSQHIDEPDERTSEWDNPPHRSHLCHACGCIWRPADVATVGVVRISSAGKADTWGESNCAAPAVLTTIGSAEHGEREAIARIIDPDAFAIYPFDPDQSEDFIEAVEQAAEEALAKADAILALAPTGSAEPEIPAGETIQSMIAWGDETFGPCAPERAVSRAAEEWREMEGETPGSEQHAIEAADVIICLLRIPGIAEALNAKMAKNRARTWNVMGDGTGYHVGGAGPKPVASQSGGDAPAALELVRRSYGWNYMGDETKRIVNEALSHPTTTAADKAGDGLRDLLLLRAMLCLSGFAGDGLTVSGFDDPADLYSDIAQAISMEDADDDALRAHIAVEERRHVREAGE